MPIIETSFSQRDEAWYLARVGQPGGSSISKIIQNNGSPSKQRDDYLLQLAGEAVVGRAEETFQSQAMLNGIEREDEARSLFEMVQGVEVQQVALVYKNEHKQFHVSPDGLIGEDAGLEIKCCAIKNAVKYLLDGKVPSDYYSQIQMSLYVTERPYWWFMSYYSGLSPLIIKVERDEPFIYKLAAELDRFVCELNDVTNRLRSLQ